MKLKKLFAIALTGVMALSVLTGCGNSTSTKSIAEAMSDMGKAAGITFKEDTKLNTKANAVVAALKAEADKTNTSTQALLAVLEDADSDTPVVTPDEDTDDSILTPAQKQAIMGAMGSAYNDQFVWVAVTETKGYNTTAQASNLYHGMILANDVDGKDPVDTYYIGTTTVTNDGTNYRVAVITAKAETASTEPSDPSTPSTPGEDGDDNENSGTDSGNAGGSGTGNTEGAGTDGEQKQD